MFTSLSLKARASLACAYSGVAWGLFWIPLRGMDNAGVTDAWATVLFYGIPLLLFSPWIFRNWRRITSCGWQLHFIGITTGVALAFYSNALLYTEVIRGLVLYYTTPVWSLLLARIVLGETITAPRVLAIAFGLAGMLVMFGIDVGFPWPRNTGDWMALIGAVGWAVAAVLLRKDDGSRSMEICSVYFFYGVIAAIVMAISPMAGEIEMPDWSVVVDVLPWALPIAVIVIPGAYAAFWGAPHLNPGVVGLLFMTELSVGGITAAIWANEPLGVRELTGIGLITLAGLSEFIYTPMRRALWRDS
ncbi:MAG: DMT family transporter [Gammaproteobacteria bacterium]|nr:DMT family transporter [Gammaproteobacteria bacterium]MDH3859864.1 DMT family transporter [Gammaproteobacteria bacterium]